jgi:hypothetical protein
MTNVEQDLLSCLLELEDKVAQLSTGTVKPDIATVLKRLDAMTTQLPLNTDPALRHYLQKKSYEKARLWLQGRESENQPGPCGHVG